VSLARQPRKTMLDDLPAGRPVGRTGDPHPESRVERSKRGSAHPNRERADPEKGSQVRPAICFQPLVKLETQPQASASADQACLDGGKAWGCLAVCVLQGCSLHRLGVAVYAYVWPKVAPLARYN